MSSGGGKYIISTDKSPPSTALFPRVPEYNIRRLGILLILGPYERKKSKTGRRPAGPRLRRKGPRRARRQAEGSGIVLVDQTLSGAGLFAGGADDRRGLYPADLSAHQRAWDRCVHGGPTDHAVRLAIICGQLRELRADLCDQLCPDLYRRTGGAGSSDQAD